MPRTCCICGCVTNTENHRQLFKFPTDVENRKKWLDAIGDLIKKGRSHRSRLFVCNQHFAESCFQRELIEVLRDGCEVSLPRKCVTLKKDSIPSIFEDFRKSNSDNNEGSALNSLDPLPTNTIKQEPLCPDEWPDMMTQIKVENIKTDVDDEIDPLASTDSQSRRKRAYKRALSPTSQRRVNVTTHVMSLPLSAPASQSINAPKIICVDTRLMQYTTTDLINDWHSRNLETFPKYWGLTEVDDGLFFGYVGDISYEVTRGILVRTDMSVEIRARNHIARFPIIDKVTSIEVLRCAMIQVVCLQLCEMAGQENCENPFFLPVPKSKSSKCKNCQIQSRKEKHNINRMERRSLIKESKTVTVSTDLQRQLSQAAKKIEAMQQCIDNLMSLSLVNENATHEAVKELPEQMQNDIRMFLYKNL